MNSVRSGPARRESALVVSYSFDVNIFSGLAEDDLREVSSLLRVHADRSQLARLRGEIDAILADELELARQVAHQDVLRDINQVLPANRMIDGNAGSVNGAPQSPGLESGPAGSLEKLTDQLRTLLDRVSERRCPPASHAGAER